MEARINIGTNSNPHYLYCKVDCEVGNYVDHYDSYQECLADIEEDIISDCKSREYNESQIDDVLSWYGIQFGGYGGTWKNLEDE